MNIIIPDDTEPQRLDHFLTKEFSSHSRTYWQKKIQRNLVAVDGKHVSKHFEVTPGMRIDIAENEEQKEVETTIPDIDILTETDDYIVIEKPAGLLTHPNEHHPHEAAVSSWAKKHAPQVSEVGDEPQLRPGIVHRLDRDVSGVMIIAKTQEFYEHLKRQFQERTVQKKYLALAHGLDFDEIVDLTFRLQRNKKTGKMSALPESSNEGKEAQTGIEVETRYTSSTLLNIFPKTGRTHQIRAHLFAKGNPIVGDSLYSSKKFITKLDEQLQRIFLHAQTLTFTNLEGQTKTYTSPLPAKLKNFLKTLKLKN